MCGIVKYTDGSYEAILTFAKYDGANSIKFITPSGIYWCESYLRPIDVPYSVSVTGSFMHRVHEFYKDVGGEKVLMTDIQQIELNEDLIGKE